MKFLFSTATIAAVLWLGFLFLPPGKTGAAGSPPAAPAAPPPLSTEQAPQAILQPARVLGIAQEVSRLHSPDTTPDEDFLILQNLLGEFRRHHGGNPVGDNDDVVAALQGKNPKRLAYFPAGHPHLDATGQLLDRWGSPYFFHALSGREMHIRSAGPDRALFTSDDLLHRGD